MQQMEDVTQGSASHVASLKQEHHNVRRSDGGERAVEQLEHYGEKENWRLEGKKE